MIRVATQREPVTLSFTPMLAVGFRLSLIALYRGISGTEDVVAAVMALPAWLRLMLPIFGSIVAGVIARWCISRTHSWPRRQCI